MRWTYIIPRLLLVAMLWGFVAYGVDPLLRYSGIQALQSVTGAKADIGGLRTQFFPPSLTLDRVALASAGRPGKNLLEFDRLHLRLEPDSLSYRRFVVEEGRIDGLKFDTRRSDDGQLEKPAEPVSEEPSWMTEKLTELGSEWLSDLTDQVKAQLDPNLLETYRTGTQIYDKWDVHFEELTTRAKALKPRVEQLKTQFENAREGDTLQQIEQYIQVAERAEAVVLDVQQFRDDLKSIVPEVREDFTTLNEARVRDQEKVRHTLSLLKPDARRISQALLGKAMYVQIQQVLTWVQAAREYQSDLHRQVRPERSAGRDFEFASGTPAPDFLLKTLALSGQISVSEELMPFIATLSDVTEDPRLLGRPCVLRLQADGSRPLQMKVTYDATSDVTRSELLADYRDTNAVPLRAGKPDKASLHATLGDLNWAIRLSLIEDQIDGQIDLHSRIADLVFQATDDVPPEIIEAANDAFSAVKTVNAAVLLSGSLLKPEIDLSSDVGEQVASGVQSAFAHQLDRAKERLLSELNSYAADQFQKLKDRFSKDYEHLMADNSRLLEQANEVRTIVASLKSGKVDPSTVFRNVADSKLIPEKDKAKIQKVMSDVGGGLQRGKLPGKLQDELPIDPSTLPKLPGNMFPKFPGARK